MSSTAILKLAISGKLDLSDIALRLLDAHPDIFIALAETQVIGFSDINFALIAEYIQKDNLVTAIKELRNSTGFALKEAKDIVFFAAGKDSPSLLPQHKNIALAIKDAE